MIKLKKMTFCNFGRFLTPQTIDFDAMPNLTQIDGENLNTGGSSGAGKSTVFQVLEFILGVNELPTTVLQSRLTKEGHWGEIVLDKDGVEFVVNRSKANGLSIQAPEGIIEGSNKIAEEYLQKLIGIPPNLLRKVFHKRQKEGGFFVGLTPKESHEFLTETLDLTSWTKKQSSLAEKLKLETGKLQLTENAMISIQSQIDGTNSVLASINPPEEFSYDPAEVAALSLSMSDAEKKVKTFQDARDQQISELKAPMPRSVSKPDTTALSEKLMTAKSDFDKAKDAQWSRNTSLVFKISQEQKKIDEIGRAKNTLKTTQNSLEALKSEMLSIKNSICPTCTQTWVTAQAQNTLNQKVERFKTLMLEVESLNTLINSENQILATIADLQLEVAKISPEELLPLQVARQMIEAELETISTGYQQELSKANSDFYAATTAYSNQKTEIQKSFDTHIELAKSEFLKAQESKRVIEGKLQFHTSQVANYNTQKDSLAKTIEKLTAEKSALESSLDAQKYRIKVLEISEKLIKSYVNQLFQGALDQIAARANEILLNIPNASTTSVSFEAFKENKNGSVKEEITTYVHMDGEVKVPLKSMSGGESTSIELAVDLAVVEMIETHTGKGLDIFIMDEPMTGMDSVSVCGLLDMLSMANLSKKIIIVDHNPEVKSRINYVLKVVREGQESRVEL